MENINSDFVHFKAIQSSTSALQKTASKKVYAAHRDMALKEKIRIKDITPENILQRIIMPDYEIIKRNQSTSFNDDEFYKIDDEKGLYPDRDIYPGENETNE